MLKPVVCIDPCAQVAPALPPIALPSNAYWRGYIRPTAEKKNILFEEKTGRQIDR